MTLVGFCVVLASFSAVLFASPPVDVFELQRRDRLPEADRFVEYAYWFLLKRSPDPAGLEHYREQYESKGPTAVAESIVSSAEYKDRIARTSWANAASRRDDDGFASSDSAGLADELVADYSGRLLRRDGSALPGRIGFVFLISAGFAIIARLHRAAGTPGHPVGQPHVLPVGYIVGLFAVLSLSWWLHNHWRLEAFGSGRFGYLEWMTRIADLSIVHGPANVWTPYVHGTQVAVVLIRSAAEFLAYVISSDIWTSYTFFRLTFQLIFLILPSIATVWLIYHLGKTFDLTMATIAATVVAFSFATLYFGVTESFVMDGLPVMLAVLSVWCVTQRRFSLAGYAIGVGAALKLFPILLAPVIIIHCRTRSERLRFIMPVVVILAVLFLPFAVLNWEFFVSPFRWQSSRPPWESWYAFVNWLWDAPHDYTSAQFEDSGYGHNYGWVFWGLTPRISALLSPVETGPVRWETIVSALGMVSMLGVLLTGRARSARTLVRWSAFAVVSALFWGIGWSPQYELYAIPFVLLAFERPIVGAATALFMQSVTFLEFPLLLPWAYFYGGSAVWLMWGALVVRYMLMGWICMYVVSKESNLARAARSAWRSLRSGEALGDEGVEGEGASLDGRGTT